MTKILKRQEKRQNSLKQTKKHDAAFINYESSEIETFKYKNPDKVKLGIKKKLVCWKRHLNTQIQKIGLWSGRIDWARVRNDLGKWLIEAVIEGFTANVATHYILHWELSPMTIMAHGFAIKQSINIYWRLRRDGPDKSLPEKNK